MSTITELNPRLLALTEAGVSVWLDQIRRSMVEGGELARMVAVESLRGVTSNPAIFEKAILGSTDYDEDLKALARENLDSVAIYEHIAIRDVQLAADVLAEVHRNTGGRDGFVSLEVAPELAHDTEGTLEQVRSFWKRVDRPNVMIKIPGTPEGVPAIEQALYEGINVNVTLLFSVAAYEEVAEAYIRALERRRAEGLELSVNSVASFFVSRVDTNVDRKLEQLGRSDLAGTAALANARAAYRRFKEMFSGPDWDALAAAGGSGPAAAVGLDRDQEPALLRHDVRRRADRAAHRQHDAACDAAGGRRPRLGERCHRRAGSLRGPRCARRGGHRHRAGDRRAAGRRRRAVRGGDGAAAGGDRGAPRRGRHRPAQPRSRPGFRCCSRRRSAERVRAAVADNVAQRVWRRDPSLWGGPGVPEIEDRLGWLTVSEPMLEHAARPARVRRRVPRGRVHRRGAARDGRLLARSRGDPAVVRGDPGRAAVDRARLDPSRRGARGPGVGRPREDAVHRLLEVRARRSRRCRTTATSRRSPTRASSSSSPIPAARSSSWRRTTGCGAAS